MPYTVMSLCPIVHIRSKRAVVGIRNGEPSAVWMTRHPQMSHETGGTEWGGQRARRTGRGGLRGAGITGETPEESARLEGQVWAGIRQCAWVRLLLVPNLLAL